MCRQRTEELRTELTTLAAAYRAEAAEQHDLAEPLQRIARTIDAAAGDGWRSVGQVAREVVDKLKANR